MLVVVASHTNAFGMAGQGSIGVLLFFVLSGYVLTMPFVDRPERVLSLAAVRRFAINRVLRIVPIFVAAVLYLRWLTDKDWTWVTQHLVFAGGWNHLRSEEHTSELQSLMRISYAVFCLRKKNI